MLGGVFPASGDREGTGPVTTYAVAAIPGDGIGGEVVREARRVLDRAGKLWGFDFRWEEFEWGCDYYLDSGRMMPEDGLERLRAHDAIFLGAVGRPDVPDHVSLWGLLIPIRRSFEQYVNLRPVRLFEGIRGPLRGVRCDEIDFVVVRENNEGEYSEVGGRLYRGTDRELAVQQSTFTRFGVERVMRYAFELARERNGNLVSATKSNGIMHTMPFWDEIFEQLSAEYRDVEASRYHVDALAAMFVLHPQRFDVVVASNLFGDILTDLGAAIAGSIGIAPSGNINPERKYPSMFEPVHGSAPDIAGKGIANPIGQIWSGAMMLEHLGEREACKGVLAAIRRVLPHTAGLTPDLGGTARTTGVTDAILGALEGPA
jgi:tartrate dehydrogenase/decarboxylase / D-malate dehydrogenase